MVPHVAQVLLWVLVGSVGTSLGWWMWPPPPKPELRRGCGGVGVSAQILQLKVGRLEQLLHLKNVRIDDLSRRLQQAQSHQ